MQRRMEQLVAAQMNAVEGLGIWLVPKPRCKKEL